MSLHQFDGFEELSKELEFYIKKAEEPLKILELGAKEFVKDLSKLAKPMSKIKKSGYTHLIDTFSYRVTATDIEVGWGKYYGKILENGANIRGKKSKKTHHIQVKHLVPTFDKNKSKYYQLMLNEFYE